MGLRLTELRRFPVKSCRGELLETAVVEPWGLAGDRRWMLVDETGEAVTVARAAADAADPPADPRGRRAGRQRARPAGLSVARPGGDDHVDVTVFGRTPFAATPADDEAHAWFSKVLGEPVRLVYADDPNRRPANAGASPDPACPWRFGDGYPLLLATEESLAALNELIAQGSKADEGPLPMVRFRPNLVVAGDAGLGGGRLAAAPHRRGGLPRGQGLRPVRDPDHRRGDGRPPQGADVHPGPAPALGRRGLVRDEPGPGDPRRDPAASATRSSCSRRSTLRTARRAEPSRRQSLKWRARAKQNSP